MDEVLVDQAEVVGAGGEHEDAERGSYVVTVRTPAGFGAQFRVTRATRVETLTKRAVTHFSAHGQLAAGNYRLVVLRDGTSVDLAASARLGESGVVTGDVLALVVTDPQVDG